jgi:hypothetical protein
MKQADLDILLCEGEGSMPEYKETLPASFARDLLLARLISGEVDASGRDIAVSEEAGA